MATHTDPTVDQIFDWSDNSKESVDIEPIHAGDKLTGKKGDYAALREWTKKAYENLVDAVEMRAMVQVKNLALWTGLHWNSQTLQGDFINEADDEVTVDTHKVIINNIYDIERNRYSKISRNQPQTRVRPISPDYDDYVGSRIGDAVLKTAKEKVKQRQRVNQMLRESFIFGESYINTWWNKDKGGVDPRWEKYVEKLRKDEKKREFNIDGESILIDREAPIMIGQHDLKVVLPWTKILDPQKTPDEVEWSIDIDYVHVETAKKMWPKKVAQLTPDAEGFRVLNTSALAVENLRNHIMTYTVVGRSTKFLPNGIRYVCTDDIMLEPPEDNDLPNVEESEWGNLHFERLTDIDVPGRLFGYSTIQILANLQHSENQMATAMKHYMLMLGTPKMLIPDAANVSIDELSDGSFEINYSGDRPPELMVPNPISPNLVQLVDMFRERMQKLGDLHGVSSGDLPNSVRAAKAIRLLQELEDLRATAIFGKYNDVYMALDRKILFQTRNYKPTDGRLASILGKGNEYLIEDFDVDVLTKDYQVTLELSGMLPQQPSARAEFITEMYQMTQGTLFEKEKWIKLLGFESEQEFLDAVTVSVIKAQQENDYIIKGKKVEIPEPFHNHLVELGEHKVLLQSPTFTLMKEKNQKALLDDVRTHEYHVFNHMMDNPMYKQYVFVNCPWYPLVFKLPKDVTAQMMTQPGVGPQQAQLQPGQPQGKPPAKKPPQKKEQPAAQQTMQ